MIPVKSSARRVPRRQVLAIAALTVVTHGVPAIAADTSPILIGQSADFSGPTSSRTNEATTGASAFFAAINRTGGVLGRKIVLKSLDDDFKPETSIANTKKLITEDNVFAMFLSRGPIGMLPVLMEYKIPLVGSISPATALYRPAPRYFFHTRASTAAEVARALDHFATVGGRAVMVVYQNDELGREVLGVVKSSIAAAGVNLVGTAMVERGTVDVDAATAEVLRVGPQVVLVAMQNKAVAALVKTLRARGSAARIVGLSFLSPLVIYREAGDAARGIVLTQVTPSPIGIDIALQREYQRDMGAAGHRDFSYNSFEGYIAARILVEGLIRTGTPLTRERFIDALEDMRNVWIGGLKVDFDRDRHDGPRFVDITMIGTDGKVYH